MRQAIRRVGVGVAAALWLLAAAGRDLSLEMKALLSRLETLGHGYHSDAEWQAVSGEIARLAAGARAAQDWATVVEVNLVESMVLSDMRGDHAKALSLLEKTRQEFANRDVSNMAKVFVRQAEVYSRLGDEGAISRLISDFKASRFYDPERYSYSGGQGRDVPLTVTRPAGRGNDSVSVTAMEMYRRLARFAPGKPFPDFESVGLDGAPVRLADYRGKVVLLDFYLTGWSPWQRDLGALVQTYARYRRAGFEIVGINLDPAPEGLAEFMRAYNMTWPQIVGDKPLTRKLGIFGEATSFLLDRDGLIIGRDLKGADLMAAVKQALGVE